MHRGTIIIVYKQGPASLMGTCVLASLSLKIQPQIYERRCKRRTCKVVNVFAEELTVATFCHDISQTSMNVEISMELGVIPTLGVPTLKDPMFVAVSVVFKEMVKTAQVKINDFLSGNFSDSHSLFCRV